MSWTAYQLVYRLESPLHVGWRKTGNLMQTRTYVPGRIFWGAVTAHLTRNLGGTNYIEIGELVKEHLRFGYFFLAEDKEKPYIPKHQNSEIVYGHESLPETKFQRRFISSFASTVIATESFAAQEGSLHEVEYIKPSLDIGKSVYLIGHLFVKPNEKVNLDNDVVIVQGKPIFDKDIPSLQIGGERRYGFGRITLEESKPVTTLFNYNLHLAQDHPQITVPKNSPFLAHTCIKEISASGEVEPLVSREWAQDSSPNGKSGPGHKPHLLGVCYTPGSTTNKEEKFIITNFGKWKKAE